MAKLTKQEKIDWDELYEYVKKDILEYEDNIKLPKNLLLRLIGLKDGKFMANKKTKAMANYTFKQILMTFKLNKLDIVNTISNKSKFKDESHKINYIMVIIENKINDVCERMKAVERSAVKIEEIDTIANISNDEIKPIYKKKTKDIKNSKLKKLL